MTKAYSYKRISSLKQAEGQGLDRQEDSVNKWLAAHPDVVLDTRFSFSDIGKSAFKGRHLAADAGLGMFLDAIEKGHIEKGSYLLIEAFDRFGRDDVDDARNRMVTIIKAGVSIVTLMDGREHNESNRGDIAYMITSLLQMHAAHDYSLKLAERVGKAKRAKRIAAKESLTVMSKQCPSWLDIVKDKCGKETFIHNAGAKTVQLIYTMREKNSGLPTITAYLNEHIEQYPPLTRQKKTRVWSQTTVRDILRAVSVLGTLPESRLKDSNGQPKYPAVAGYYGLPVISLDQWNKVQSLNVNGGGYKERSFPHGINLFRGLIRCSKCDGLMTIEGCRAGYHGSITCRKLSGKGCDAPRLPMRLFEDAIVNRLLINMTTEEYDKTLQKSLNTLVTEISVLGDEMKALHTAMRYARSEVVIEDIVSSIESITSLITEKQKQLDFLRQQSTSTKKHLFRDCNLKTNEGRIEARGLVFSYVKNITLNTTMKSCDVIFHNGKRVNNFSLVEVITGSEQALPILEGGYLDGWSNLMEDTGTLDFKDLNDFKSESEAVKIILGK
ncbi:recombinase family protein [Pectobacterium colocasium]|uniref:recombinase family protein n=1 Tax=Pectobacterium colocasium TaxID=2878098 RepID=UPI003B288F62